MVKYIFIIVLFLNTNLYSSDKKDKNLNFYGEVSYIKQGTQSLISNIGMEYKIELYRTESVIFSLYGKIDTDLDNFGNEIKNNVFTTFCIDF